MKLLGSNTKLAKCNGLGYLAAGLTLAPYTLGGTGHNVCPSATIGCRKSCVLWFSGRRVTELARNKAKRDTRLYFENRAEFLRLLHADLASHRRKAQRIGVLPLVRLNMASDLVWDDTINTFPDITFFDYTKIRSRFDAYLRGKLPPNYYLTFSASETSHPATLRAYLERGGNVATVFNVEYNPQHHKIGPLPSHYRYHGKHFPVVDGDVSDLRLPQSDGRGVIVGLRLKGTNKSKARAIRSSFATSLGE